MNDIYNSIKEYFKEIDDFLNQILEFNILYDSYHLTVKQDVSCLKDLMIDAVNRGYTDE